MSIEEHKTQIINDILKLLTQAEVEQLEELIVFIENYIS